MEGTWGLKCSWPSKWSFKPSAHLSSARVNAVSEQRPPPTHRTTKGEREQRTRDYFIGRQQKERTSHKIQGASSDPQRIKGERGHWCTSSLGQNNSSKVFKSWRCSLALAGSGVNRRRRATSPQFQERHSSRETGPDWKTDGRKASRKDRLSWNQLGREGGRRQA